MDRDVPAPEILRAARPAEAAALSELAFASKSVWSYTPEQLEVFRAELTLAPTDLEAHHAHVLEAGDALLGFYTLVERADGALELEHLFVAPGRLRKGAGTRLLRHALGLANALGHRRFLVQSDPNAEGFYLRHGARLLERIPSSIPGRTIPLLELAVPPHASDRVAADRR